MLAPESVDQLTPNWLSHVIDHTVDGCVVRTFGVDEEFEASSAASYVYRIELSHTDNACKPGSLILKFPSPYSPYGPGIYAREATVYGHLARYPELAVPRFYGSYVGSDPDFIVTAIEDVSPATPGSQILGCTVGVAKTILRQFADIHGLFWGSRDLPSPPDAAAVQGSVLRLFDRAWRPFLDRYGDQMAGTGSDWDWFRHAGGATMFHMQSGPRTLIHGDAHLENVLIADDPTRPTVIIDWQLGMGGNFAHDATHFMVGNLSAEDRCSHEREMLDEYLAVLRQGENVDVSSEELFTHYRAALTRSMFRPVSALLRAAAQPDLPEIGEFADVIFQRVDAAVADLNPSEALQELGYRNPPG